jgi:hypothetical protein
MKQLDPDWLDDHAEVEAARKYRANEHVFSVVKLDKALAAYAEVMGC